MTVMSLCAFSGFEPQTLKKKKIMASKKQKGDGKRGNKREKIKQVIVLRRRESRKKQGKTLNIPSR